MVSSIFRQTKLGRWTESDIACGPVISEKQMNKILGYIQSGHEQGATLITGGRRVDRQGYFV
jgi:acyl-CoA reductase-like NAD-dependent aldehyde dehydrogenase